MRRRNYLATLCVGIATTAAGCSSNTGDGNGSNDNNSSNNSSGDANNSSGNTNNSSTDSENDASLPKQPSITTEDMDPEGAVTSLEIQWNATVFDALKTDPDQDPYHSSEDGKQFLILQLEIVNTGEETANFVPGQLDVMADGTEAGLTILEDGGKLEVDLEPGNSIEDWIGFTIPEGSSEVVVSIKDNMTVEYATEFSHDKSMDVGVTPYSPSA